MPTLQYRLSSRVSQGRSEVLVRFYSGAFGQRAKSRIFAPTSAWNAEQQQLIVPRKISPETAVISETQHKLDSLRDYVYEHWWSEQYEAREGWLQKTIDNFHGIKMENRKTVEEVCRERLRVEPVDHATELMYGALIESLSRFTKGKPLYIDAVSKDVLDSFVEFFRRERVNGTVVERSQNTISSRLKRLRAIMHYAVRVGYIEADPFFSYKIPTEVYGDPICLTIAERDALYRFDGLSDALKVQRDIFVFQCHIGCRVSDLMSLTLENIDGDFLQYIAHKTRREKPSVVRVPLSDTAKEIICRYSGDTRKALLPFIRPSNYNEAIHTICRQAGLDRVVIVQNPITRESETKHLYEVVSSHTARKTFAQAMFSLTKSERITSSLTGHAENSKAFARYAVVDDEMKQDAILEMNAKK